MSARRRAMVAYVLPIMICTVLPLWWYERWSAASRPHPQRLYQPQLISDTPVYVHHASSAQPHQDSVLWTIRIPATLRGQGTWSAAYGHTPEPVTETQWIPATWESGHPVIELEAPTADEATLWIQIRWEQDASGAHPAATAAWLIRGPMPPEQ